MQSESAAGDDVNEAAGAEAMLGAKSISICESASTWLSISHRIRWRALCPRSTSSVSSRLDCSSALIVRCCAPCAATSSATRSCSDAASDSSKAAAADSQMASSHTAEAAAEASAKAEADAATEAAVDFFLEERRADEVGAAVAWRPEDEDAEQWAWGADMGARDDDEEEEEDATAASCR
jgi:hypothetical protein